MVGGHDDTASLASNSQRPISRPQSAYLAESVYDGVKYKLKHLQDEINQRDLQIAELRLVSGSSSMLLQVLHFA